MASKRSKTWRVVDRISDLPDSILIMILSLLPFETAVQTSTLSKRWRPLCMSLVNLHFDDRRGEKSGAPFNNLVDRFLMNRPLGLNIEKLGLGCRGIYDIDNVDDWVCKALDHQVKDLTLDFDFRFGRYELLDDMYTYGNFEALRLVRNFLVNIPNDVSFSRVKVLEFCHVTFSSYESIEDLLLNCPVLEDLVIKGCEWLSGVCLAVCGSALKNLKFKCNKWGDLDTRLEIVIDTPGLQTLKIADSKRAEIFIDSTLLSLRTASIDVGMVRLQYNQSVFRLLDNIYHVKFLTLNDKAVGALDDASHHRLPTFHNLIQLEIRIDNWSCWDLLRNMLASSPKLQTLLLPWGVDLTRTDEEDDSWCGWETVVPECLSSHLKTVEIGALHGTDGELSLVESLLLYGRVLRNMSITFSMDCILLGRKSRLRKKLVSLGRHYKTCKIDVKIK